MDNTHSLMLENRQGGRITGVKDVKSFDEKEILLFTQAGKLVIKGEQLHVKQLDLEKGEVDLEGKVDFDDFYNATGFGIIAIAGYRHKVK